MMGSKTATSVSTRVFPESDGKPMAETDLHRKEMVNLIEALEGFYRQRPDVYVSGDLLLYFDPMDPKKRVAPDVFVVKGVPKHDRRIYKLWEEGKSPSVVIEVSSKKTAQKDQNFKFNLYQDVLRVPEYFLFDPEQEYLSAPLIGFRLGKGGSRHKERLEFFKKIDPHFKADAKRHPGKVFKRQT